MNRFGRYAIYYIPADGPLADFGAAWLGWDCQKGVLTEFAQNRTAPYDQAQITKKPQKYGFHGTIKPPFRLADGSDFNRLRDDFIALCLGLSPVTCDALELSQIGRFLALTPVGDTAHLSDLAARVVMDLDHHRAPPTDAELARRRQTRLSDRQNANLMRWGYPYVMDDFQFHMTLTASIPPAHIDAVLRDLRLALTPILPKPFSIQDLALCGEDENGYFHVIDRHRLGGAKH